MLKESVQRLRKMNELEYILSGSIVSGGVS